MGIIGLLLTQRGQIGFSVTSMRILLSFLMVGCCLMGSGCSSCAAAQESTAVFPLPLSSYSDAELTLRAQLWQRLCSDPLNGLLTLTFFLAVLHTFAAPRLMLVSRRYWREMCHLKQVDNEKRKCNSLRRRSMVFHFLGEVEVIFGIWLLPLIVAIVLAKGFPTLFSYLSGVRFTEPIFVVVIMMMAASGPILYLTEICLSTVASLGGGSVAAWWLSILTLGPLLGSFITEPAAMTICASLLAERFFCLQPSLPLRYATLGLLFVNISVGGTLTHFAAPPVVMVASKWGWGMGHMFYSFGWKAVLSILISNTLFFLIFRRQLLVLSSPFKDKEQRPIHIPAWVTVFHMTMIAWVVLTAHHPTVVVLSLFLFLVFVFITPKYQRAIPLRGPLLVGFFLMALVIHGDFQQWWLESVLRGLGYWPLMVGSTVLTAFNDNAAITYLASLVPNLSDCLKFSVVAGAVAGGGLTVIANAPNPAGQNLLQKFFGEEGIHPVYLFAAAIAPTLIVGAFFVLLP